MSSDAKMEEMSECTWLWLKDLESNSSALSERPCRRQTSTATGVNDE